MRKTVWIAIAFAVVFLLFVVSTTFQGDRVGVVTGADVGSEKCRRVEFDVHRPPLGFGE